MSEVSSGHVLRIGGLDPSLQNFGMSKGLYGTYSGTLIITDLNLTETKPDTTSKSNKNVIDLARAETLCKGMLEFYEDMDIVMVELPTGSQSSRACVSYGICVGLVAALSSAGKKVLVVTPKEVKAVTGNTSASKEDVIQWAFSKYPDAPWLYSKTKSRNLLGKNEHLADSVAAIFAGIKKYKDTLK